MHRKERIITKVDVPHLAKEMVFTTLSQESRIVDGELSLMMIMQLFIKSAVKEGKNWVGKRGMDGC